MKKLDVMRLLDRLVEEPGWNYVYKAGSGHYRVTGPNGALYFASSTPSDYRTLQNTRAALRRLGAPL
jgi:hypothetical protein